MRSALCACLILSVAACASPLPPPAQNIACTAPRPQVCTMIYAPVCADMVSGETRQYSSACNACADDRVSGYRDGACPE